MTSSQVGFGDVEAVPVAFDWPGAGIPKLREVLRGVAKLDVLLEQIVDSRLHGIVVPVVRFDPTQQDIGIDQVTRHWLCFDPRKSSHG